MIVTCSLKKYPLNFYTGRRCKSVGCRMFLCARGQCVISSRLSWLMSSEQSGISRMWGCSQPSSDTFLWTSNNCVCEQITKPCSTFKKLYGVNLSHRTLQLACLYLELKDNAGPVTSFVVLNIRTTIISIWTYLVGLNSQNGCFGLVVIWCR